MAESIVAPHFDDITFSDSSHLPHRGGIFADAKRTDKPIDEVLAELLASLGPTPQAASAAAQREKNDEKAPVPENPTVSNEDTAKDIKAACDHCGQKMPDIRVEDANVVHTAHAEGSKSEKPREAKQHSKKNSWAWNGTRQFFNSSPALDSLTPASFKYQGPSISTSAPSSPVPPRNLPPPYERPQEPAPSSQQEDPDTSALGHLRGVLERDELSRPDSSPPGLQRRSSTSSRTSQMDSVGKESRSPSVRRNSLVEEPVDFTQSSSEDSDAAKSISSSHSESALDQATPTEERQLSLRPRSHTSSIRSSPRSFSPDPGPSSLPDHLSHIQPPPKRTVLPDPQSTTTFMETLKARANEKGFDIDHARDAMRSWSVKWGKKDNQPAESLASEVPSGQRDRAGSDSRPVVSNNGVSLASGQTTTSLSTTATSDQPTNVSPKASTSSLSPTETPSSTKPSTYKPAPTMSIPGIMNPAHRGGLGSDGPRTLVPQRPGDAPQPSQESRARLIPANFKMWGDKSKDQPPVATPSAPRRVPPPYVPKNPSAGSSEPALSSSQSLFEAPPGESADDGQEPKDVSTLPQVNTKLASPPETKSTGHDGTLEHLAPSEGRGRSLSAASSDADTEGWEFDD